MSAAGAGRIVPGLALADLRHERILSLCLIVALVAILAPLMLLLGLRYGSIEMLRARLVQNPSFREVWPTATLELEEAWFERMRARPEVAFVLPTILRGASIIGARRPGEARRQDFDLIASAPGDALLAGFALAAPGPGEVVLSQSAAEKLGLSAGGEIELEVTRQREGRRERETVPSRVAGVLPFEADGLDRIYAPFELAVAVDRYREGLAVPELGWPGGAPRPFHSFDGALLVLPAPLGAIELASLPTGTGFVGVEEVEAATFTRLTGLPAPAGRALYEATTLGQPALAANLTQLRNKLRGRGAVVLPYVRPWPVRVGDRPLEVVGLSLGPDEAAVLGVPPTPWGRYEAGRGDASIARIALPGAPAEAGKVGVALELAGRPLALELEAAGEAAVPTVPLELLASLRTGGQRRLAWDPQQRELLLARTGFSGFRLYARTIDEVPALWRELVGQGLSVEAHIQQIERIQVLDRGLLRLFLLIASVGGAGGCGALVASLYASVERKRRELGVLRLMGLSRAAVSRFPLYQGLALSGLALVGATAVFLAFAAVINVSFADEVAKGGTICRLPPQHLGLIAAVTLAAALLSSLAAARRATRIEPAEAIREE